MCPRFGFITGKKGSGEGNTHTHTDKGDRTDSGNQDGNQKVVDPPRSPGSRTEARKGCGQMLGPRVSQLREGYPCMN